VTDPLVSMPTASDPPVAPFGTLGPAGAARPPTSEDAFPIESPTVDEGFDETTDQQELRRTRGSGSKRTASGSMPAVQNSAIRRTSTGSGLRPVHRSSEPEPTGMRIDDDYREHRDDHLGGRHRHRARSGRRWSLVTLVMSGAVAVLTIFIVARMATREPPGPPELGDDATLLLGKALVDLDEGRREEGRAALATLASDRVAPSEVLAPLAKLHYRDGRLLEAQALFERLVERNPGDPEALAWLGLVQAERKDLERARESFEKALPNAKGELAERLRWLVAGQRGAAAPSRGP
jgi:hypothetical protein